jgi:hypothetical protein
MAIGITPSDVATSRIRQKMEQADLLKIEIADLRAMIALLERQIALERAPSIL